LANSIERASAPDSAPIFFVKLSELHTIRIANLRAPHSIFLIQNRIQIEVIYNSAKNVDLFSHAQERRRYVRELFEQIGFIENLSHLLFKLLTIRTTKFLKFSIRIVGCVMVEGADHVFNQRVIGGYIDLKEKEEKLVSFKTKETKK
jgi:hypothetical protein